MSSQVRKNPTSPGTGDAPPALSEAEEVLARLIRILHDSPQGETSVCHSVELLGTARTRQAIFVVLGFALGPLRSLTSRQRDVARLAGQGMSTHEIADLLRLSRGCVDKHLRRIYSKLGCSCRATLARLCIALDAIDPPGMAKVPAARRSDT